MPKNIKGGKSHKKGKNSTNPEKERLLLKEGTYQNYGLVTKCLGDLRFNLVDPNNQLYLGKLRGKMKGRQRIRVGDLVLICYRETGEQKVDIIHKYNESQAKQIIRIENISFPDGDHPFSSQSQQILFEDDQPEIKETAWKKSGADRIAELYVSDSDNSDVDEEDGDAEEDGDTEEHTSIPEKESVAPTTVQKDFDGKVDKKNKIDHRADYKDKQKTGAAAALLSNSVINIDDI